MKYRYEILWQRSRVLYCGIEPIVTEEDFLERVKVAIAERLKITKQEIKNGKRPLWNSEEDGLIVIVRPAGDEMIRVLC